MNPCALKDVRSIGYVQENWGEKGILFHIREFNLTRNKKFNSECNRKNEKECLRGISLIRVLSLTTTQLLLLCLSFIILRI